MDLSNTAHIIKFGNWLKEQRVGLGLSLREASWRSGMSLQRLLSIESGTLEVGINNVEVISVCKIYRITSDEFLLKANGQG